MGFRAEKFGSSSEAVVLPLNRACPGGIETEKCFGSLFCLEVSPLRPLPAEHGEEFDGRISTRGAR